PSGLLARHLGTPGITRTPAVDGGPYENPPNSDPVDRPVCPRWLRANDWSRRPQRDGDWCDAWCVERERRARNRGTASGFGAAGRRDRVSRDLRVRGAVARGHHQPHDHATHRTSAGATAALPRGRVRRQPPRRQPGVSADVVLLPRYAPLLPL